MWVHVTRLAFGGLGISSTLCGFGMLYKVKILNGVQNDMQIIGSPWPAPNFDVGKQRLAT